MACPARDRARSKRKEVSGESLGKYRGVYRVEKWKIPRDDQQRGQDARAGRVQRRRGGGGGVRPGEHRAREATEEFRDVESVRISSWTTLSKLNGDIRALRRTTSDRAPDKSKSMSVYRGVHRCSRTGRYRSEIEHNGKKFSLGVHAQGGGRREDVRSSGYSVSRRIGRDELRSAGVPTRAFRPFCG